MVLKWYEMSISDVRFGYFVLLLLGFERFTQAKVVFKSVFHFKRFIKSVKIISKSQIRSLVRFKFYSWIFQFRRWQWCWWQFDVTFMTTSPELSSKISQKTENKVTWPLFLNKKFSNFQIIRGSSIAIFGSFWIKFRLSRCWWRMLETKCVGDKFDVMVSI